MEPAGSSARRVVLIGGGHAHVLVLERWRRSAPSGVDVTVISDQNQAVYSGMIPAVVAGHYELSDAQIDVASVAERAGVRFVLGTVERIDAVAKQVFVSGHDPIGFDVASVDIGSTVAGLQVPGVADHSVPTRPIHDLVERLRGPMSGGDENGSAVVVGAGAAGVELALALRAGGFHITLVDAAERPLAGHLPSVSRRARKILTRRGILLRLGAGVSEVESDCVRLTDGTAVPSDLTVWAAGAGAHGLLRESDLPVDSSGFVRVGATLQVQGSPELFAAGDCASFPRPLPKAGVYAVRQADVLYENIVATLEGRALHDYRPQRDYLTLLNLSDGTAMGTKWGLSMQGRSMWWLKDRIDTGFMARFEA